MSECDTKPVIVVGGGPVGLIAALGLSHYGIPVRLFEANTGPATTTKAGTILPRTLEVLRRYEAVQNVVAAAIRVDEIGEVKRSTGEQTLALQTSLLKEETRFPYFINLPQHHFEPLLIETLNERAPGAIAYSHKLIGYTQDGDGVTATFETDAGNVVVEGSYLLGCDGGRSTVRSLIGAAVDGMSLDIRYTLIDLEIDLDIENPRDYPYLTYFSDPEEWMILIRQPHGWRFVFPAAKDAPEPTADELKARVFKFIGDIVRSEVLETAYYRVHHRVASSWRDERVFLMGDAAHLLTPMWALGLNTGVTDSHNLPWRLSWVLKGLADASLLDGYEKEQKPIAIEGAGEMAEAARHLMDAKSGTGIVMGGTDWANIFTRSLLGMRLDVDGVGSWSMVCTERAPVRVGERLPDFEVIGPSGTSLRAHDLIDGNFLALHLCDARRKLSLPADDLPRLRHFALSRWDVSKSSSVRARLLLDIGDGFRERLGLQDGDVVVVRPDDHIVLICREEELATRLAEIVPNAVRMKKAIQS
ncbi:hypothetical protein N185_32475 [Sinorhizobium sp. GW3]|nr:hypothetical protein N185_32475 [Sinorhizobium sp. GW3]